MTALIEIANTGYGLGAFAAEFLEKGTPVTQFEGPRVRLAEVPEPELNYIVRVESDLYMIPQAPARLFNHSCAPNCFIDDFFQIVTVRPIEAGEQLTIAYNQVSEQEASEWGPFWHPKWTFQCQCGATNCPGTIDQYVVVPSHNTHATFPAFPYGSEKPSMKHRR